MDRIIPSAQLRAALGHLVLLLVVAVLPWVSSDLVPWVREQPGAVGVIGSVAISMLLAWVTPLTRSFGAGSDLKPTAPSADGSFPVTSLPDAGSQGGGA
jgi:hypothetical protein